MRKTKFSRISHYPNGNELSLLIPSYHLSMEGGNFSREEFAFAFGHYETCRNDLPDDRVNNYKGSTINLRDEINSWDTNGKFSNLTSNELRDIRNEYEVQYLIQILPKQECKIM